jgi:hypothetical protein
VVVDMALVEVVLGPAKYASAAEELSSAVSCPGVAAGLVWTAAGEMVVCWHEKYSQGVCGGGGAQP